MINGKQYASNSMDVLTSLTDAVFLRKWQDHSGACPEGMIRPLATGFVSSQWISKS